jgi:serine O-acetyltransferase
MHGISRLGDRWGLSALSRAMDLCGRLVYSASIPGKASIGENVFFHHGGLGVVINAAAVIERDCEIGVHVVLGGRAPQRGAKIIGPIRVGAGAVIAANAVVLEDVPPRCLVAGVPASIKRRDIDNSRYRHDAPISDAKL